MNLEQGSSTCKEEHFREGFKIHWTEAVKAIWMLAGKNKNKRESIYKPARTCSSPSSRGHR